VARSHVSVLPGDRDAENYAIRRGIAWPRRGGQADDPGPHDGVVELAIEDQANAALAAASIRPR
jgi:hypothetical protein